MLAGVVNEWLRIGDVHLGLFATPAGDLTVQVRQAGDSQRSRLSLFGAIAMQMMLAVANTRGWAIYSDCGQMFDVGLRRPRADRRRYCGQCGKRAAWRYAQARRRAARRAKVMPPESGARNPRSKR